MKKTDAKKFAAYLEGKMAEYRDLMNLNNWQVRIAQEPMKDANGAYMATSFTDAGYTKVLFDWAEEAYKDWKKGNLQQVERAILHEMTHVLVRDLMCTFYRGYPNKEEIETQHERLCENVSVILHRMLEKRDN